MEPGDADVEESMPVHSSTAKLKEAEKYFSTGNLGMKVKAIGLLISDSGLQVESSFFRLFAKNMTEKKAQERVKEPIGAFPTNFKHQHIG